MRHFLIAFFMALAALLGAALVLPPHAEMPTADSVVTQPKSRSPQPSYDVNQWVQIHSTASLAGALRRCAESGDYENRIHVRITRVYGAIVKALDKGNPDNQQMWQLVIRAYEIGHTRGLYVPVVPDPSDGGVKFGDHVEVQTAEACKAAEAEAARVLGAGGHLDIDVGDEA